MPRVLIVGGFAHHVDNALFPPAELRAPATNPPMLTTEMNAIPLHVLDATLPDWAVVCDTPPYDAVTREEHFRKAFGAASTGTRFQSEKPFERAKAQTREVEQEGWIEPFRKCESWYQCLSIHSQMTSVAACSTRGPTRRV